MKNLVNLLIGLSVLALIAAVISRLMLKPILGLGIHPQAMVDFTVAVLLLAIALSVKK